MLWDWACPLAPTLEEPKEGLNPEENIQVEESSQGPSAEEGEGGGKNAKHATPPAPYTGLQVSCMTWNKANKDLLAVGYGSSSFNKASSGNGSGGGGGEGGGGDKGGLIAFFSLKNPGYPLRHYQTRAGVTSVDFSTHSPNILGELKRKG